MVESRDCNFCGRPIEPGTGKMYVKKDGTIFHHCSNKCKKNQIDLKRVPRGTRWTTRYAALKESALKHEEKVKEESKPKKKKKMKKKFKDEEPAEEPEDEPTTEEPEEELEEEPEAPSGDEPEPSEEEEKEE